MNDKEQIIDLLEKAAGLICDPSTAVEDDLDNAFENIETAIGLIEAPIKIVVEKGKVGE